MTAVRGKSVLAPKSFWRVIWAESLFNSLLTTLLRTQLRWSYKASIIIGDKEFLSMEIVLRALLKHLSHSYNVAGIDK